MLDALEAPGRKPKGETQVTIALINLAINGASADFIKEALEFRNCVVDESDEVLKSDLIEPHLQDILGDEFVDEDLLGEIAELKKKFSGNTKRRGRSLRKQ